LAEFYSAISLIYNSSLKLHFPKTVFRAYDIRGIASGDKREICENFAKRLGQAFVTDLIAQNSATENKHQLRIVVGRDNRHTSENLAQNLITGLRATGAQVFDLGLATSPYFYFAVCSENFDGGIQITASHNPTEFNGFKLVRHNAIPFSELEIKKLRDKMLSDNLPNLSEQNKIKEINLKEKYYTKLKELALPSKKLKVVVDCGHGVAGHFAPEFLRQAGTDVVELFCELDSSFPYGVPNPEEQENLIRLQKKVLETEADLGIAFDGDGDRLGAVDSHGRIIPPDQILILLARELLERQPGAEIIFDVKASGVVAREVEKLGGRATRWLTGHSFIKQKMRETGAHLAGEISGHIFFGGEYFGFDDALLAAVKLVTIAAKHGEYFPKHLDEIPQIFATPDKKIPVEDEIKFELIERISLICEREFDVENISRLDGVRIDFDEKSWVLIRASNTSPCLTLRFESDSTERLAEIQNAFLGVLAEAGLKL
jgi:phosphomannomutase / phosphoglucomutase